MGSSFPISNETKLDWNTLPSVRGCCTNTVTRSVLGRTCSDLPSSGGGLGSFLVVGEFSRCVTGAFHFGTSDWCCWGTPTHRESGGGCPTCPWGNVLLKQVHPGRSSKKPQLARGRTGDVSASKFPHLSHLQPWEGQRGVCAHFTDSLVTPVLCYENGVHSPAGKTTQNCCQFISLCWDVNCNSRTTSQGLVPLVAWGALGTVPSRSGRVTTPPKFTAFGSVPAFLLRHCPKSPSSANHWVYPLLQFTTLHWRQGFPICWKDRSNWEL